MFTKSTGYLICVNLFFFLLTMSCTSSGLKFVESSLPIPQEVLYTSAPCTSARQEKFSHVHNTFTMAKQSAVSVYFFSYFGIALAKIYFDFLIQISLIWL